MPININVDELDSRLNSSYIVVMHDFFIDRIVRVCSDADRLFNAIRDKIFAGGGSIRGIEQYEIKGGNAVNLAYALCMLNARCRLVTIADEYGSSILKNTFSGMSNIEVITIKGKQGYTVSLEFSNKANVMLSDVGDNAYFGYDRLNGLEYVFANVACIAMVNWASNNKGNELALHVFNKGSKALHFIDPADISGRGKELVDMLRSCRVDVLSINENECRVLCNTLGLDMLPYNYSLDDVIKACKSIASELDVSVDIHTPKCSVTSFNGEVSYAESFKVDTKILTGAGDVWDAGDIIGYICNFDAYTRLVFANACAALYVKNCSVPRLKDVYEFIINQ